MTLDGRTAIVTGAGQGIGRATALALAQAGANVAAVDINATTVFLASPAARNITGQSFNVDGGLILD